jgi:hypothetical protein
MNVRRLVLDISHVPIIFQQQEALSIFLDIPSLHIPSQILGGMGLCWPSLNLRLIRRFKSVEHRTCPVQDMILI